MEHLLKVQWELPTQAEPLLRLLPSLSGDQMGPASSHIEVATLALISLMPRW